MISQTFHGSGCGLGSKVSHGLELQKVNDDARRGNWLYSVIHPSGFLSDQTCGNRLHCACVCVKFNTQGIRVVSSTIGFLVDSVPSWVILRITRLIGSRSTLVALYLQAVKDRGLPGLYLFLPARENCESVGAQFHTSRFRREPAGVSPPVQGVSSSKRHL